MLAVTRFEISLFLILLHKGQSQVPPPRDFSYQELQPRQKIGYGFSCVQPGMTIYKHGLPHSFLNTTGDLKESRYFDFSAV